MSGFLLKLLALVPMLIDHTGHVLFPGVMWMRYIGRLAFPIYCFLLVEGFLHTRDLRKYMGRLAVFAVISEIPFDLAIYGEFFEPAHQNVFITLLFGLMAISIMSIVDVGNIWFNYVLRMLIAVPFGVAAQLMHTDYRWIGVGLITVMFLFHDLEILKLGLGAVLMLPVFTNSIEYFGLISFVPMHFYNGRRGIPHSGYGRVLQWFFYIFYPVHLLVLAGIRDGFWL